MPEVNKMSGRSARVVNPRNGKVKTTSGSEIPVRSFQCVSVNGRKFNSKAYREKPSSAASSVFSQWSRKNSKSGPLKAKIIIRETTRNSLHNEYAYEISRQKLSKPKETVLENKKTGKKVTISYKFNYKCKSIDPKLAKKSVSNKKKTMKKK